MPLARHRPRCGALPLPRGACEGCGEFQGFAEAEKSQPPQSASQSVPINAGSVSLLRSSQPVLFLFRTLPFQGCGALLGLEPGPSCTQQAEALPVGWQ